jgi:hypothetical protein
MSASGGTVQPSERSRVSDGSPLSSVGSAAEPSISSELRLLYARVSQRLGWASLPPLPGVPLSEIAEMIAECIPDQDSAEDGGTRSPDAMHGDFGGAGRSRKGWESSARRRRAAALEESSSDAADTDLSAGSGGEVRRGAVPFPSEAMEQAAPGSAGAKARGGRRRVVPQDSSDGESNGPSGGGSGAEGSLGSAGGRRRGGRRRGAVQGAGGSSDAEVTGGGASEEGAQSGGGPGASSGAEEEEGGDALGGLRESLGGLSLGGAAPRRTPRRTGWAARDWGAGGRLGALGGAQKGRGLHTRRAAPEASWSGSEGEGGAPHSSEEDSDGNLRGFVTDDASSADGTPGQAPPACRAACRTPRTRGPGW